MKQWKFNSIAKLTVTFSVISLTITANNLAYSSCYKTIKEMEFPKEEAVVFFSAKDMNPNSEMTMVDQLRFNKLEIGNGRTSDFQSNTSLLKEVLKSSAMNTLSSLIPHEKIPNFVKKTGNGIRNIYNAINKTIEIRDQNSPRKTSYLLEDAQLYLDSKKENPKVDVVGASLELFLAETTKISNLSIEDTAKLLLKANSIEYICGSSKIENTNDIKQFHYDNFNTLVKRVTDGDLQEKLNEHQGKIIFPLPPKKQEEIKQLSDLNDASPTSDDDGGLLWDLFSGLGSLVGKTISTTAKIVTFPVTFPIKTTYKTAKAICSGTVSAVNGTIKVLSFAKDVYNVLNESGDSKQSKIIPKSSQNASLPSIRKSETVTKDESDNENEDEKSDKDTKNDLTPVIIDVTKVRNKAIEHLISESTTTEQLRLTCKNCDAEYYAKLFKLNNKKDQIN
ncbi:MAG: hypothetical protein HQK49_10520 [Oligoflexia bacterium]|nr:hypothetical protein [Oligoflexia bacterium]